MFRGHCPPPGGCAAADPVRQAGSAVRTCRAARRNRPPALAARCRHRLPAGAERNPERRPAMAADERRAGDTLSALAQRGELEPERLVRLVAAALRRLHDLDPAACPFDHRLERRLDTVRQRVEAGLVDEADFDDDHRGRSATELYRLLLDRRPAVEDLVVAHGDACLPNLLAEGGASAASSIAAGSASPTGTRTWPWPRGTSRPNSARPGPRPSSSNTAAISTANGWRTSGYWTSSSRVGPVRVRTGFGLPLHENEVQRHRPLSPTPPRALARSAESPVQFSRYCASSFAESTRIRLGSVLCMACTKVLGISISRK